jgi:Zn-finger nucleic acid-binding protein
MNPACPRDRSPTERVANEGHAAYRCTQCGGLWLPGMDVHALLRERHVEPEDFRKRLVEGRVGDAALACPAGHAMTLTEYRTLEIDWCTHCDGIWFDAGELRRLLDLHPDVFTADNVKVLMLATGAFLFAPWPTDD